MGFDANDEESDICSFCCISSYCQDRSHFELYHPIISFLLCISRIGMFSVQTTSCTCFFNQVSFKTFIQKILNFCSLCYIELIVLFSNALVFKSSSISKNEKEIYGYIVIFFIVFIIIVIISRMLYSFLLLSINQKNAKSQLNKEQEHAIREQARSTDISRIHVESTSVSTNIVMVQKLPN